MAIGMVIATMNSDHGALCIDLDRQKPYPTVSQALERYFGARDQHKKIFEPFYSSKNSNTSWGMGLYHVRTIVRAHVGSLRVESKPGRGTSFFVLLPKYVQDR